MAKQLKGSQALLVTTHHLPIDQTGPHLQVVHGLDHQREAVRPAIAAPGNQADAAGISTGHQPIAIVLDLVNPTGPRRRLVGRGWQARLDEGGQHAAYLGGRGKKSILQERNTARRIGEMPRPLVPSYPSAEDNPAGPPWRVFLIWNRPRK